MHYIFAVLNSKIHSKKFELVIIIFDRVYYYLQQQSSLYVEIVKLKLII